MAELLCSAGVSRRTRGKRSSTRKRRERLRGFEWTIARQDVGSEGTDHDQSPIGLCRRLSLMRRQPLGIGKALEILRRQRRRVEPFDRAQQPVVVDPAARAAGRALERLARGRASRSAPEALRPPPGARGPRPPPASAQPGSGRRPTRAPVPGSVPRWAVPSRRAASRSSRVSGARNRRSGGLGAGRGTCGSFTTAAPAHGGGADR